MRSLTCTSISWKHTCQVVLRRAFGNHAPSKGDRVVVAMSGGVDSSVTAKLMADQDFDLSAIYMRNWDTYDESGTDTGCEWEKDWEDVQRVCRMLGIPFKLVDLSREYWTRVFEPSLATWERGQTPNPDIWCNREIKFGALLDSISTDSQMPSHFHLATGHYARKSWSPDGRPMLLRAKDRRKDQTYYLSGIKERGLERALFPIGHLEKREVRALAQEWGLPTAERAESMGICFVGEKRKFSNFIAQYIPPRPGDIIDLDTRKRLGTHQGLWTYTIGQGARVPGMPEKTYVASKNVKRNLVFVVRGADHSALYHKTLCVSDFCWIWSTPPPGVCTPAGFRALAQFRHNMIEVPCTVRREADGSVIVLFDEPQKAVASGQTVTIWDGDWCLGCGPITLAY